MEACTACSRNKGSLFPDSQGNRINGVWSIELGHQKEIINGDLTVI